MGRSVASLYPDWPQYASRIRDAVRELTPEQLALRAGPAHAPIWGLAAHVAGARVYWLCGVFGEPGAERTSWPAPMHDPLWEDDEYPRPGPDLAWALDSSWEVIRDCLERWSIDDLDVAALTAGAVPRRHNRASVLDRLCSHDAFHGGEISQLLGLHGLPPIGLWARDAPR